MEAQCLHDGESTAYSTLTESLDLIHIQNHSQIDSHDTKMLDNAIIIPKHDITPPHGENPSCTKTLKRCSKNSKHDQCEMVSRSGGEASRGYFASDSAKEISSADDDCDEDDGPNNLSKGNDDCDNDELTICSTSSLTGNQDLAYVQNHSRIESHDTNMLDNAIIISKNDITLPHGENLSRVKALKRCLKDSKHDQNDMVIRSGDEASCGYFVSDSVNNVSIADHNCDEDDDPEKLSIGDDGYYEDNNLSFGSEKIEFSGEALLEDPLIILGFDISSLSRNMQYYICATGVFGFTLIYSYLQELISVHILGRKYALFFATCTFAGYSFWSFVLLQLRVWRMNKTSALLQNSKVCKRETASLVLTETSELPLDQTNDPESYPFTIIAVDEETKYGAPSMDKKRISEKPSVILFIGLSLLRAIDVGMTNSAMRFINYPAKTLIKSSRSSFTLIVGMMMGKRGYSRVDFVMVAMIITGLVVFLRADKKSDAIFHPYGIILLVVGLSCDAVVGNSSEILMRQHRMSQDQFQLSIYSISFIAMLSATIFSGQFFSGMQNFFLLPGTIPEIAEANHHLEERIIWTGAKKGIAMLIFTLTGLLGSSCAGALTKEFGALSMSIISTNRKATTLFLSFMAPGFHNRCTLQHVIGMIIFLSATSIRSIGKLFGSKSQIPHEKQPLPNPHLVKIV